MNSNIRYIASASEYIRNVKPLLSSLSNYLLRLKDEISEMESPKKTKAETKEKLTKELNEAYQELINITKNLVELSQHIQILAQGDKNGRETTQL